MNRFEVQLTEKIRQHFNEDELREICFRLKIDYEDLPGSGRAWKARELVLFCEKKKRLEELTTVCYKMFPDETWQETEDSSVTSKQLHAEVPQPTTTNIYGDMVHGDKVGNDKVGGGKINVNQSITPDDQGPVDQPSRSIPVWIWVGGIIVGVLALFFFFQLAGGGGGDSTATPVISQIMPETPTSIPTITPTPMPDIGSTRIRSKDEAVMMYVPIGEFMMGSEDGNDNEQPIHAVYLDNYWIDRTEVTNGMYDLCAQDNICQWPSDVSSKTRISYYMNPDYADYPVIYVSWEDAKTYCEWAGVRLPTEAEWEKAARWDDENKEARIYPWGEEIDCNFLNYYQCVGDTTPVGNYPDGISFYGALDMAGNVWEWVIDRYDAEYIVLRGGAWENGNYTSRSTYRYYDTPVRRDNIVGFRCAQDD